MSDLPSVPHGVDMPISTQCPKCQKVYRLKDELLGKRVACADKACRTLFEVVPYVPPAKPVLTPRDAEAIAAAALIDEPDVAQAVAEDTRKIDLTCLACDCKWQVAWSMQGKNALCPECKTRQKVPEQKAANKIDWRNPNAKRPSLAKQEEVPDDVWGSKGGQVSVGSLKEAGAIKGIEYEARPISFWIKLCSLAAVVLAVIVGSGFYWYQSKKQEGQLKLIDAATADIAALKDAGLSPTAVPQIDALFNIAAAEFAIRQNSPEGLKAALDRIAQARQQLQDQAGKGQDKDAVAAELISVIVALGGTPAQVKSGTRIYWSPSDIQRKTGAGTGRDLTVVVELQNVFQILMSSGAEADWRFASLRRAVRELHANGQGALAEALVSSGFRSDEQNEATAVAALEQARVSGDMTKAAVDAENLKQTLGDKPENVPAAASALWMLAKTPGTSAPSLPDSPGLNARMAHTLFKMAQNQTSEALTVAQMPGPVDDQLRALAMIAEQSSTPHEAVAGAAKLVTTPDFKTGVSTSLFVRLSRAAGAAGNDAAVEAFGNAITDDGMKLWARAEAFRSKVAANRETKAEDPLLPPDDPKKIRAGVALTKLVSYRQNQQVANRGLEAAANGLPSGSLRPFALMGLALGAQDGALR